MNQEHNLMLNVHAFPPFAYVCCKKCMPGFPAFVPIGNILFKPMQSGNCLLGSASLSFAGDN